MTSALDDVQLMAETSAGRVDAFAELFDRFCDRAYGVAFSVCRDDGRAQDAVQETFLLLWNGRASYRPQRGTVAAWLLTMVRYRALDLARRNGTPAAHWPSDERLDERPTCEDPPATVVERDTADRLRVLLARLPAEQEEVITLAYYGHLSHAEIATQLHLPPGTVKGRMRLGLQTLRASIDQADA